MTKTRKPWKRAGLDEVAGGVDDGDRDSCVRKETERSRYWRGVIADWEVSGMTQAGFCRSRGLKRGVVLLVETSTEGTRSG